VGSVAFLSPESALNATQLFQAGKLQEAIDAQIQAVKAKPGDHGVRLFLFELLAFAGDLDRAQKHLDVVTYGEMELDAAVATYRKLLDSERARRQVYADGTSPQFLEEPPAHVKLRLEALGHLRQGKPDLARQLLTEAETTTPVLKGTLNDKPFELLRDADDVFGTVIEVMAKGNYFWVPLEQIESIDMNPPRFPRDVLWRPALLATKSGSAGDAFLPSLYPGTHEQPETNLKLARGTDWIQNAGPVRGIGVHTFLAGEDASTLLDWRKLRIE
jgi:type VI secretion system protein ImpE